MSGFTPVLDGLRPVFIVGHPRSGTTLAQQLLSSHPDFWSGPETHLYSHVLLQTVEWQDRPLRPDELPKIFARLAAKPAITVTDAAQSRITQAAAEGSLGAAHLLDAIMHSLRPAESTASRWLEKTPRHVYHVGSILRLFPDARIIHLLRDPRDVASSPVRFGELGPGLERSALVIDRGDRWNEIVDLTDALTSESRMITVRYEDIIAAPEQALQRMMDHIGVEADLSVIDRFGDTYAQVTVASESVRKQLNSAGKILDRRGIHRQRMTHDEIVLVDTICTDRMRAKGYTPDYPPQPALVDGLRRRYALTTQARKLRKRAMMFVRRSGHRVLSRLGLRRG